MQHAIISLLGKQDDTWACLNLHVLVGREIQELYNSRSNGIPSHIITAGCYCYKTARCPQHQTYYLKAPGRGGRLRVTEKRYSRAMQITRHKVFFETQLAVWYYGQNEQFSGLCVAVLLGLVRRCPSPPQKLFHHPPLVPSGEETRSHMEKKDDIPTGKSSPIRAINYDHQTNN